MRIGKETIWNRCRQTVLMHRWFLYGPWGGVLLHKFEDSDDISLGLHDHPWDFLTIVLFRGYDELLAGGIVKRRFPGTIAFRRAETLHAVRLRNGRPSWSLCIIGRRRRRWGFMTKDGWRARAAIDQDAFTVRPDNKRGNP